MKVDILTLFPEMFTPLEESIIGRAKESGKIEINVYNIRDYSKNKHKNCDDYPFGGGAGMVMTPQPIADAIKAVDPDHKAKRIFTSPKGSTFTQKRVKDLKPYEKNPRLNDDAVKYVAESIKEFGFKVPIVIDKNNVRNWFKYKYIVSVGDGNNDAEMIAYK